MSSVETEIWKCGDEYKITTEKKRLKNNIKKLLEKSPSEVYMLKGKEIGWGFTFEKKLLSKVRSEVKKVSKKKNANKRTNKKG